MKALLYGLIGGMTVVVLLIWIARHLPVVT